MIYFSSDHHFYHKNIIQYTGRPFTSVAEMNQTILDKHNSLVTDEDIVYFLGDFAFCSLNWQAGIFDKMRGRKYLILGNHDRKKEAMSKVGFIEVFDTLDIEYQGIKFRLCHYPFYPTEPGPFDIKYKNQRPSRSGCDFLLCGHIHEKWLTLENQINVGVDVHDFYPITFENIVQLTKKINYSP